MCTIIFTEDKEVGTQEELAEFLGSVEFVFETFYTDKNFTKECCLCPISIPKTLEKFGIEYERDIDMDYCVPSVDAVWGDYMQKEDGSHD